MLQRVLPAHTPQTNLQLFNGASTRTLEASAARNLGPHVLMQRAGTALFRWTLALYPHAQQVWVACGPGNNGGDGAVAALALHRHLQPMGGSVWLSWLGKMGQLPDDAHRALSAWQDEGLPIQDTPPEHFDVAIDAVFGIGRRKSLEAGSPYSDWLGHLHRTSRPVLAVDAPSQLDTDTGYSTFQTQPGGPRHTLALLTLKPGLFTGHGRHLAGDIWFDNLQRPDDPQHPTDHNPTACLFGQLHTTFEASTAQRRTTHNTHKGQHGDVWVVGGEDSPAAEHAMTGAALLAARAALSMGAGRVLLGLLNEQAKQPFRADPLYPDLIFQSASELVKSQAKRSTVAVCGCGAGKSVNAVLPQLLESNIPLVLDADALNAIASSPEIYAPALRRRGQRGCVTVLTPHPLEAARLLRVPLQQVAENRLACAQSLADTHQCTVVLKGSGTITAHPGRLPIINPTGNGLLGVAGTGDVLAGMIGGRLCAGLTAYKGDEMQQKAQDWAADAVYQHGLIADQWPDGKPLLASQMPQHIRLA